MKMYAFRIRFFLLKSTYIGIDETDIPIEVSGRTYILKGVGEKISNSSELVLIGRGFKSEKDAFIEGCHVQDVLRWCGASLGIPIDLGNNKLAGGITEYTRNLIYENKGINALNSIRGLMVYEDDDDTIFIHDSIANFSLTKDKDMFKKVFQEFHQRNICFSPRTKLAYEFYNLAKEHEENSFRVKFLLNMVAMESLIQVEQRPSASYDHVNELIEITENNPNLDRKEKDSIKGTLNHLRNESITKAGQNLVAQHLGDNQYYNKPAAEFFKKCYDIRSKLVHTGKWQDENNIISAELDEMLTDLLLVLSEVENV
jgi:hypothetical protein